MPKRNVATAISSAIKEANAEIILKPLREVSGETTIGELIDSFTEHDFTEEFRSITVDQFQGAEGSADSKPRGKKSQRPAKTFRPKSRNTRTEDGREAIDADIRVTLEAFGGVGRCELYPR